MKAGLTLFAVLCLGSLGGAGARAQTTTSMKTPADETLDRFFKQHLEAEFRLSPMQATSLGDHRFDSQLDDVSAPALQRRLELTRTTLERLPQEVNYATLSRDGQVDFEILRDSLTLDLWQEETERSWENDPRLYSRLATECAYVLLTQSTLPRETNVRNIIARIKSVPAVLAAAQKNLRNPPQVRTETAIQQNTGAIAFYERELFEMIGETPQLAEVREAAAVAAAALRKHQTFLGKDLLPRSTGEWRIGRERFARKLELVLNAGLTSDEVLAEAEAACAQVRRDMLLVARQLWARYFPRQALPPDDETGRHETIARVLEEAAKDHSTPETLAGDARNTVGSLKEFIAARDLLRLPEPDRCQIIEMPEFQRGNSSAFLAPAPPLDADAASIYAVSPPPRSWSTERVESFLREYNRQMLKVLTIHEAYPGHYVQLEYANRNPSLLRRVLGSGVYAEGWANYCEQMIVDQGFGDGDLVLRLMQMKFLLRSVTNAILDHQMHCTGLSDDEALAFLTAQAFQSEGEARLKIIRAKLGSCQLSTYFVGRSAFMRLRAKVQRELGEQFDLGRFHEAVLATGSVPVKYLPELTRERLKLPR